jgi:hypothetical protein
MRDMDSQSDSSISGTCRGPLGGIKLAGERLRGWIEAGAARVGEAALYQSCRGSRTQNPSAAAFPRAAAPMRVREC